jgi:hypothetical protein
MGWEEQIRDILKQQHELTKQGIPGSLTAAVNFLHQGTKMIAAISQPKDI